MLKIESSGNKNIKRIRINAPDPVVPLHIDKEIKLKNPGEVLSHTSLRINENNGRVVIREPINPKSHIFGMGERAFEIDRKRHKFTCYNVDPGGYIRGRDPLTLCVPYYVHELDGKLHGILVNSAGKVNFDFGLTEYDSVCIEVEEPSAEVFYLTGETFDEISMALSNLTGKPATPPIWSFGHVISRVTYYPQKLLLEIVNEYLKEFPVSAICIDIHYMDRFLLFTWDPDRYPDPEDMIKQLHALGIKVITNIDPSIKLDQNYTKFSEMIGGLVETKNGEVFVGDMWPGKSVFPDFFTDKARKIWTKWIKKWLNTGVDGIWLDMNEPTTLSTDYLFPPDAVHSVNGRKRPHKEVRNAYANLQAMATLEAYRDIDKEPFILSRSGTTGLQKYSMTWTGDNTGSYDDLKLQISIVISLGICGLPFTGCDLGGFLGPSDPELVAAYYRTALFFPFYRNHKNSGSGDQELYLFPKKIRESIASTIQTRYEFIPYLYDLSLVSGDTGVPLIKGLFQVFKEDRETYWIDNQYMVGDKLLYAPLIQEQEESRDLYLPAGNWTEYNSGNTIKGPCVTRSENKLPIYLRDGTILHLSWGYFVYGKGSYRIMYPEKVLITFDGADLVASDAVSCQRVEFADVTYTHAKSNGRPLKAVKRNNLLIIEVKEFRKISLS